MEDKLSQFYKESWFFQSVMDNIQTSVIVTDFTPKIIYVNGATEELFGYTKEEMIGSNPEMYNAEPGAKEIQRNLYKTVMDGEVWQNKILNKKKNGEVFINKLRVSLLKNKAGEDIGFIGFQEDVTEVEDAKQNVILLKDRYYFIFKNAPRLITLVYEDGTLKDCNDRIFDFLGYTKEEVIGKNVKIFFPEDQKSKVDNSLDLIGSTVDVMDEEYDMVKKNGDIINVTIKSAITTDEEGRKHTICFIADITKQKEIQTALRKSLLELKKSNEELEEFAYVASHDLQEPLRVVASYCQLLKEGYYDILDDDGQTYVNYAVESAVRMKTLIKELLDFSRVGRRDKPFEHVSVEEILQEAVADYQMVINDSNAKIVIDDNLPIVFAIRFRMKQLIANIISNALKFKSERSPVINIGCCDEGSFWLFYIKDNGIGIDSQFFDRIFGIFKRLYSRDEYPGTGIGLALCKRIVETHGGKIWVDSEENKGTCMYFTIPKHIEVTEVISL